MTNKQHRFLVMSEAEFEAAMSAAERYARFPPGEAERRKAEKNLRQAEAACRARPVISCEPHYKDTWVEVQK